MEIDLEGIVVVVGNYGSGKTEVSVNLAMHGRRRGFEVRIADLDLVNPYFRTREVKEPLREMGVDVVLPPEKYHHADLPILTPAVAGMIRKPSRLTVLDVGGDDVGATVLAALGDAIREATIHMIQVVNPHRPFTDTAEGALKIKEEIEQASRLTINGVAGNANMMHETTVEDLYAGHDFVREYSEKIDLPLRFITVSRELLPEVDLTRFTCPVLPIDRRLTPPWSV
ncbi:MAG: cobalamin biosynthesis protein CbiA [Desulfobacterales bacterium]|nr:cobalamin biosynthesis protein CbiA [Desulfobacterales bacterium]